MTLPASRLLGRRLLAVFAHPDDESVSAGGLLACCADGGARVSLLCLSRGEGGPAEDGSGQSGLADTRERELRDAAAVLGVHDVLLRNHPDGMLPWLEPGTLQADIAATISSLAPDVVVTFGEDGLYWHPDHIAVHEATTAAVASLGSAGPALFYVTTPPGQMRAVVEAVSRGATPPSHLDILGIDNPDAFGAHAQEPTLVLQTGPFAALKLAAIRCHRTQAAGGPFDHLDDAIAPSLLGVEHLRRSTVGHQGPVFVERLTGALGMEHR